MKQRKIIGHRGAAGLELENTATSIERALHLHVSAIELDLRLTKDDRLVVLHDSDLARVANNPHKARNLTLSELKKIRLLDGSEILSLPEALRIIGTTPVILELKDTDSARLLLKELKKFPQAKVSVASFKLNELALLRSLAPTMHLYALELTKPFESIQLASMLDLDGIGLNFWLLNPLTYHYARRKKLKIYVFTLNRKFIARFISWLYPTVAICTDHPEWFVKKPHPLRRKKKGQAHASHLRTRRQ